MQLVLLRLLSAALGLIDGVLHVRWGERLLTRMADRWQVKIAQLDKAMAQLAVERKQLQLQSEALALHAAAIYLGGRNLARGELRFDPGDPEDEEILDATIDLLVKERLAAVEPVEIRAGRYVYYLEPDWAAIRTRLTEVTEGAEPEIVDWLCEGLRFIDESFLSETGI
jgi:hypothetical protein